MNLDRSQAPIAAPKIPFEFPEVEVFTLANGIEVYFVYKKKLPIVYLSLLNHSGSKFDPEGKKGLSYLTSLLIDEGAGEFDPLQLNDEFEKLGSIFNISTDQDFVNASLLSLKENFERSLYLLSKVLIEPHFEEKDFQREKKKVLDRILQLQDDAGYIASTVFERLVFKNSFYELPEIGFQHTVNNISRNNVINFYNSVFRNASMQLFVVGDLDKMFLESILNQNLNLLQHHPESEIVFNPIIKIKTQFYLIDKKDSPQCEIRIGHISKRRNCPDYYATRLMNTILGGQFSSRINLNLREAKGFTYGANSSFGFYKESGVFEVRTSVNIENTAEAITEIFKELKEIRENISTREIEFAKSTLIKQYPSRFETYTQITKNIESFVVHSISFDEMNCFEEILQSVTNEDVQKSARENIFPDEALVILCGDKEKISAQLESQLGIKAIILDATGEEIN